MQFIRGLSRMGGALARRIRTVPGCREMMKKKTIKDMNIRGKRVLIRVDFNVPFDGKGDISDDTRIRAALPTIHYALQEGASLILMSHLGRPKGMVVESLRLTPVAKRLSQLLGREVKKVNDCVGEGVREEVKSLPEGEVLLLENLRFHPEEEKNNQEFAQELADLGEVFINDAFGTAHRAHASTEGVARLLPAAAGLLMDKEIEYLSKALENPAKPFLAILGGAKVSDKIGVIENLLDKVDGFIIGGGMAYTFLKAQGKDIGDSLVEEDKLNLAKNLIKRAEEKGVIFLLPFDHIIANEFSEGAAVKVAGDEGIPAGWQGLDIGEKSREEFVRVLGGAKAILWNGPMGVFEMAPFAQGTDTIAKLLAGLEATTIIGGGDTVAAIAKLGLSEHFTHISTGGGASLEFLEGKALPGLTVLDDK